MLPLHWEVTGSLPNIICFRNKEGLDTDSAERKVDSAVVCITESVA